jgi:hypothetical protein
VKSLSSIHRLVRVGLAIVVSVVLAACGDDSSSTVSVSGYAHAGPMCPVASIPADPACADRPVEDAVMLVRNSSGVVIAEPRSGVDGTFVVELSPGSYTFMPQPVEGLMGTAPEQEVVVGTTPVTGLDFAYDTGIR